MLDLLFVDHRLVPPWIRSGIGLPIDAAPASLSSVTPGVRRLHQFIVGEQRVDPAQLAGRGVPDLEPIAAAATIHP